jgi:hypothetical protein
MSTSKSSPRVDTKYSDLENEYDNKYDSDEFEETESSIKANSQTTMPSQSFANFRRPSSHREPNGLSSNELKERLIQVVKRKGIVDSLKVD